MGSLSLGAWLYGGIPLGLLGDGEAAGTGLGACWKGPGGCGGFRGFGGSEGSAACLGEQRRVLAWHCRTGASCCC